MTLLAKKLLLALVAFLLLNTVVAKKEYEVITLAGGCFWCMEAPFDEMNGVIKTTSGYIGGKTANPTYEQVSGGGTGHTEAVQVTYDSSKVKLIKILDTFWRNIDPTDKDGQFVDRGDQYRPGIFFHNDIQKNIATKSLARIEKSKRFKKEIVVEITKASTFYPAEDYHQDYYKKSPIRYKFYRFNSGRDQFLKKYWKK